MRKEIIFAILVGAVFGLVVAFGVWRANIAFRTNPQDTKTSDSSTDSSNDPNILGLTIAEPNELEVFGENNIDLKGITKPNSWLVISDEEDDYIIRSDTSGSFTQSIELVGGVNQILISVFGENGDSIEKNLKLVYSTEFFDQLE